MRHGTRIPFFIAATLGLGFALLMQTLRLSEAQLETAHTVATLQTERTAAARDFRFANQLTAAATDVASDITEGFHRFRGAEFASFIRYARASLAETEKRLRTGVLKHHFTHSDIEPLLRTAKRLGKALMNFESYLLRKAEEQKRRKRLT